MQEAGTRTPWSVSAELAEQQPTIGVLSTSSNRGMLNSCALHGLTVLFSCDATISAVRLHVRHRTTLASSVPQAKKEYKLIDENGKRTKDHVWQETEDRA